MCHVPISMTPLSISLPVAWHEEKKRGCREKPGKLEDTGYHAATRTTQVSYRKATCEPKPETLTSVGSKHI